MLKEQLIELLDRDEPDYNSAASLGPECLPDLLELTKEGGARLAPRAVYTASLIKDNNVTEILKEGASSPIADVRIATAAAIQNQSDFGDINTLSFLLNDSDVGVRKVILKTISKVYIQNNEIHSEIKKLVDSETNEHVRSLADEVYTKLGY